MKCTKFPHISSSLRTRPKTKQWADFGDPTPEHRRRFLSWVGQELAVIDLEGWYSARRTDIVDRGGGYILCATHDRSYITAIVEAFPEHNWSRPNFPVVQTEYWPNVQNHRRYFEWLAGKLNIISAADWYRRSGSDVIASGGGGSTLLMSYYNGSYSSAVMSVFPEHKWNQFNFTFVPNDYWPNVQNQRNYFEWLAGELDVISPDDWYNFNGLDLKERGGLGLLHNHYKGSYSKAVMSIFPEHQFDVWRFASGPLRLWKCKETVKQFIQALSKKLHIQNLKDWYRVDHFQIARSGGANIINRNGGLAKILSEMYPDHPWVLQNFSSRLKKSSQRYLFVIVKELFPDYEILEDFLHPGLLYSNTHRTMQLDIFIPQLCLAFEYQGQQHFYDGTQLPSSSTRDDEKSQATKVIGITLIPVPYWWDFQKSSLLSTIREVRPDLLPKQ